MAASVQSVEKETVKISLLDNFRTWGVLKYLRKLQRKYPWWSGFVGKIKKNILLPRMFSWKFSQNFQNNHFVEHFQFLIKVFWLNDNYLFLFWTLFLTSVRVTLKLLAINVEKPLQWRLQTRLFFCLRRKK